MAKDYGMRGAAAGRLMKGKKGAPEDDLGLPPEDAAASPEGAPMDLAALLGGGAPGEAPMEEGPLPPEGAGGPEGPADLDTALGGVEAALAGVPEEDAEEIRNHLNAIREIAARSGGGAPMPPDEGAMPPPDAAMAGGGAPPPMGGGMMEPQA